MSAVFPSQSHFTWPGLFLPLQHDTAEKQIKQPNILHLACEARALNTISGICVSVLELLALNCSEPGKL